MSKRRFLDSRPRTGFRTRKSGFRTREEPSADDANCSCDEGRFPAFSRLNTRAPRMPWFPITMISVLVLRRDRHWLLARYRFPPVIIQHAVRLYFRLSLGYRDDEDLLAERGIDVSYGMARRWLPKFGQAYARRPRAIRPRPDARWHLDEVFTSIADKRMYLWRAVDGEGEVLDILVQSRRNKKAAPRYTTLLRRGEKEIRVEDSQPQGSSRGKAVQ